ncbi:alpha/beta-hydrolase [Aulographum hederae CBS 113979]|uniref:Alpha/beta-hydrolase n=1 Tax=Aulographum hederae CBS 113979 TaxID=1176131 RepID=A0A6G1GNI8_9PEZI|nr:alpha/beta-hydrolase [Aulographum hederae CBS 113979]
MSPSTISKIPFQTTLRVPSTKTQSIRLPIRTLSTFTPLSSQSQSQPEPKPNSATSHDSETLTLPSGRTLGYGIFGHPHGRPLLYFHGFPTSRLEAAAFHEIAHRHRIRLFALDRPGFGISTFQPHRRIVDWPDDVLAFADHVGLDRFAVMGLSGGGPYALACALKVPRERLSAVGIVMGAPPWEAGREKMSLLRRVTAQTAVYAPPLLGAFGSTIVGLGNWACSLEGAKRRIDVWIESETQKEVERRKAREKETGTMHVRRILPEDEVDDPSVEECRERMMRSSGEGFAQGSQAFVHETRLLSAPDWGFRFEDVKYDPVLMWHGTKDVSAPFSMMQYLARRLPHAVLHECEGDTHFTMDRHLERIIVDIALHDAGKGGN